MHRRLSTCFLIALFGFLTVHIGLNAQTVRSLQGAPVPVLLQKLWQAERIWEGRQDYSGRHRAGGDEGTSAAMKAVTGISGRLMGVDDIPGSGAHVIALPEDENTNGGAAAYARVNTDGTYLMEDIGPGSYRVVGQADNYLHRFYKNSSTLEDAMVVSVADGRMTTGIDITLEKMPVGTGAISGRVLSNRDGAPVSFAQVIVMSHDDPNVYNTAVTNENGTYSITGLYSGNYIVQVWAEGYLPEFYDDATLIEDATTVVVQEPEERRNIDFRLSTGGTITGRVVDGKGKPIIDAWIEAVAEDPLDSLDDPGPWPWLNGFALTDEFGRYEITGLSPARYSVVATVSNRWSDTRQWYNNAQRPEDATLLTLGKDEIANNINFSITVPPTEGVITGIVRDKNGRPFPGAIVQVMPGDDGGFGYYDPWMSVQTDEAGRYRIENLPDGSFYVMVSGQTNYDYFSFWWPNADQPENATAVVLENARSTPSSVDFNLGVQLDAGSISGAVRLADGTPLADASIELVALEDENSYRMHFAYAVTDEFGRYNVQTLPPGIYTVRATYSREDGFAEQWYLNAGHPDSATTIRLAKDQARGNIDFTLTIQPTYGRLAGRVLDDATGAPITRALVEVSPVYIDYDRGSGYGFWNHQTVTDANGAYRFNWLPQGEYIITVFADGVFEMYDDAMYPEEATFVEVRGGDSTTADIGITPYSGQGGAISGKVTGEEGERIDLAVVLAWPMDGMADRPYTGVTKADGSYRIAGLPDGEYLVTSFAPEYITEFYENSFDPWEATPVVVKGGGSLTGINFTLIPQEKPEDDGEGGTVRGPQSGGMIYGRVTASNGAPLRDATVYLLNGAGEPIASSRTGTDGSYELSNLPPDGNYRLRATHIGYESRYNDNAANFDEAAPVTLLRGRMNVDFVLDARASSAPSRPAPGGRSAITLHGSRPNPATDHASIEFALAAPGHVRVAVTDLLGREVAELHNGNLPAGEQRVRWNVNGTGIGNGIYICRIEHAGVIETTPIVVLR